MSASVNGKPDASRAVWPGLRRWSKRGLVQGLCRVLPAVLAAGLLAACGTANPSPGQTGTANPSSAHPGTANPSPAHTGAAPKSPRISSKLRQEEGAIHQQVLASLHHDSDAGVHYGTIPSDLRNKQAPPRNQVLSASAAHPAIAIQGNSVQLHLAHGSALATAVGPNIPDRVQGTADVHTAATWDLTFAKVHGTIPVAQNMFTITDEQGALLWPRVSVVGGGSLPKTVPTGRPFTLKLTTVVSVGDGKLRYAPSGAAWLAEWDFDVETD